MREKDNVGEASSFRPSRATRTTQSGRGEGHGGRFLSPLLVLTLIYALLSTGVAAATVRILHKHSTVTAVAHAKYLVLIVLDGARPDFIGSTPLPHLDALRLSGTQFTNAFDGILESETPSGHTTIATGSSPARNGILGFDWAQSDNDYSIFSPDVVRAGAMEHIMQSAGTPTIASLFKQRYPKAKVVALSGHKYYAADPLGGPQADAIMYYQGDEKGRYVPVAIPGHTPPDGILNDPSLIAPTIKLPMGYEDNLATKLAIATFNKMHQQVTLINYPEFDWPLGHVDGGSIDPTDVTKLMQGFDKDLGQLEDTYRKAGVLDKTLFVITADHGMTPLVRFVPESVITNAVSQAGTTAPAISYNTATYIWLADGNKSQAVAQNILKANDPGVQSAYYLTTVNGQPRYVLAGGNFISAQVDAANQYMLATLLNGHQPNVVMFTKAGQTTSDPKTGWKGDHGGNNWQSQNIPLIIAGPNIHSGLIVKSPVLLQDIAPTALTAMGIKSTGMQGTAATEALISSSAIGQKARSAEVRQIAPLATALLQQDNYDAAHSGN